MSSDFNIGAFSEAVNNKMDRDTNNATAPFTGFLQALKDSGFYMVMETGTDETTGVSYRIWSDGYCEQWGIDTSLTTYDVSTTIQLLKEFKDVNYTVSVTVNVVDGTATSRTNNASTMSKTPNSFVLRVTAKASGSANTQNTCWRACGYLAEGQY